MGKHEYRKFNKFTTVNLLPVKKILSFIYYLFFYSYFEKIISFLIYTHRKAKTRKFNKFTR